MTNTDADPSDAAETSSTTMSHSARDHFLADRHVGVLHVAADTGTLAVPVWYTYSPDSGVSVITGRTSRKGRAIAAAGRFGLVAQAVDGDYRYVSVEGPLVESRPCDYDADLVPMAARYLGDAPGERYASAWRDAGIDDLTVFTMQPERLFTGDYTGQFAALGVVPSA